jgi:hypothetical protein
MVLRNRVSSDLLLGKILFSEGNVLRQSKDWLKSGREKLDKSISDSDSILKMISSVVRGLANLLLEKLLLSRSEESRIRQLPFPAMLTTNFGVRVMKQKKAIKNRSNKLPKHLQQINHYAAGIDIGSRSHFVAVPEGVTSRRCESFPHLPVTLNVWQIG